MVDGAYLEGWVMVDLVGRCLCEWFRGGQQRF